MFYYAGVVTNKVYEVHLQETVDDCQGIDGGRVLFVNGENASRVDVVEGCVTNAIALTVRP